MKHLGRAPCKQDRAVSARSFWRCGDCRVRRRSRSAADRDASAAEHRGIRFAARSAETSGRRSVQLPVPEQAPEQPTPVPPVLRRAARSISDHACPRRSRARACGAAAVVAPRRARGLRQHRGCGRAARRPHPPRRLLRAPDERVPGRDRPSRAPRPEDRGALSGGGARAGTRGRRGRVGRSSDAIGQSPTKSTSPKAPRNSPTKSSPPCAPRASCPPRTT